MSIGFETSEVPVVVLYNLDPSWTDQEQQEVISQSGRLGDAMAGRGHAVELASVTGPDVAEALCAFDPLEYVVLNWCESLPGIPHSEPLVARQLEANGFCYSGADQKSLALSQDKCTMKRTLAARRIPTPAWQVFSNPDAGEWNRFPAIVKAACEHCSEGLCRESVVMNRADLESRIAEVIETLGQPALVEDFVDGREFHVSLWGNGTITMLPPAEMDFSDFSDLRDRLCTYDSKFVPGSRHYEHIRTLLPAPLETGELRLIERACRAAYRAVGCRDYGRIDVRMRDGVCYVLDVNPNADISSDASLACAAEEAGYSYGETGSRIVRLAAHRHPVFCGGRQRTQAAIAVA